MRFSRIFILLVFVDAVRCQCDGNHVNLQAPADGIYRNLQSPNYGNEYGRRADNCAWTINLPSPNNFVIIYVQNLRLHYLDNKNNIHCMPSYDFRINGEKFGCEPGHFVSTKRNEFCIQFRAPTCAQLNECSDRQTLDEVQITFNSNEQRVKQGQTPLVNGFHIRYGIFDCPGFGTSITNARTTVTRTIPAASTQRPFNTFPGNRNSVGRPHATASTPRRTTALSTVISTVRTTTTTNAETNTLKGFPTSSKSTGISSAKTDSSNELPIGPSASNATHGLEFASTASPTANKSRGEDDFDTKLSFTIDLHWIILASALGGGLLLILVVAICCKIRRNKKSKVESEETDADDSSSNHDKTEIPAYLTVEDVPSNQKSSQQEAINQNANETGSNLEEKLVVENVAYESLQESPTTSISQPDSTLAESIQNNEDKPAIIDEPGDEFYSVVRLKSNNEKTTVRYLKENILYSESP